MKKRTSNAFSKKVYLLGTIDNRMVWLEHPSWDCNWYWGFGYVEEYTNHRNPSQSRDIVWHTHWNNIHKEENPFDETTFSDKEYNVLKSLFDKFYKQREKADKHHRSNEKKYNKANKKIEVVSAEIIKILTP